MKRTRVSSTALASFEYSVTKHVLEVEFKHGGVYQYFGIPAKVYAALKRAKSRGTYFVKYIRNAGYPYCHVEQTIQQKRK